MRSYGETYGPEGVPDNIAPELAGRSSEAVAEEQRSTRLRKPASRRR
jgi:hypothetical protein